MRSDGCQHLRVFEQRERPNRIENAIHVDTPSLSEAVKGEESHLEFFCSNFLFSSETSACCLLDVGWGRRDGAFAEVSSSGSKANMFFSNLTFGAQLVTINIAIKFRDALFIMFSFVFFSAVYVNVPRV